MRIAGAILAGGKASRMGGVQKGLFECFPNRSIITHLTDEMRKSGLAEIFILANDPAPLSELWQEVIPDICPGNGPLGGIEAGLTYAYDCNLAEAVLFIPCDMPCISHREISTLLDAFHRGDGRIVSGVCGSGAAREYPLCCVVPVSKRRGISAAIDNKHLKVAQLWNELGAVTAAFDNPKALCNINTPRDLELWKKEIG